MIDNREAIMSIEKRYSILKDDFRKQLDSFYEEICMCYDYFRDNEDADGIMKAFMSDEVPELISKYSKITECKESLKFLYYLRDLDNN